MRLCTAKSDDRGRAGRACASSRAFVTACAVVVPVAMAARLDAAARLIHPKSALTRTACKRSVGALPWEQTRWPPAEGATRQQLQTDLPRDAPGLRERDAFVGRAPKNMELLHEGRGHQPRARPRGRRQRALALPPPPTGRRAGRVRVVEDCAAPPRARAPRRANPAVLRVCRVARRRRVPARLTARCCCGRCSSEFYGAPLRRERPLPRGTCKLPTLAMVLAQPHRLCPHTNGVCYLNRVATFCGLNTGVIFANLNHPRLGDLLNEWWNSSHSGRCRSHFLRNRLWEQHCLHTLYGGGGRQRPPLSATRHLVGQADFLAINSPVARSFATRGTRSRTAGTIVDPSVDVRRRNGQPRPRQRPLRAHRRRAARRGPKLVRDEDAGGRRDSPIARCSKRWCRRPRRQRALSAVPAFQALRQHRLADDGRRPRDASPRAARPRSLPTPVWAATPTVAQLTCPPPPPPRASERTPLARCPRIVEAHSASPAARSPCTRRTRPAWRRVLRRAMPFEDKLSFAAVLRSSSRLRRDTPATARFVEALRREGSPRTPPLPTSSSTTSVRPSNARFAPRARIGLPSSVIHVVRRCEFGRPA